MCENIVQSRHELVRARHPDAGADEMRRRVGELRRTVRVVLAAAAAASDVINIRETSGQMNELMITTKHRIFEQTTNQFSHAN